MKGIVLAGGAGTRLFPLTRGVSKQLMPIYDKPMIYYPLSILMLSGIREICVITTPHEQEAFRRVLGDGKWLGIKIHYEVQANPEGIAQAFLIAKDFIEEDSVALILGDNIFYGHEIPKVLRAAAERVEGATVFATQVKDPERYGVVDFDSDGKAISVEEKPKVPKSHYAITGLYFYDNDVVRVTSELKPSSRGELEITDVNKVYLEAKKLHVELLGRGVAWLDTGTHESLLQASNFIQTIQDRQGLKASCLEEIAFRMGYIEADDLVRLAEPMQKNDYGQYLLNLAAENKR